MILFTFSLILLTIIFAVFLKNENYISNLALSLLLMLGFLGIIPYFLTGYYGFDYQKASTLVLLFICLISATYLIYLKTKKRNLKEIIALPKISNWEFVLLIFISILALRAYFIGVRGWDAYSLYDMRAKMFMDGFSLTEASKLSLFDNQHINYYLSYPLMTSVLHAVFYSLTKGSPMTIYALFYGSFTILFYATLKNLKISNYLKYTLFALVVFNPLILSQLNVAYTNLPMLTFLFASFYTLIKYLEQNKNSYWFLSSLFLSFSTWTRSAEKIYIIFFIAAGYILFTKKDLFYKKILLLFEYLLPTLLVLKLWNSVRSAAAITVAGKLGLFELFLQGIKNISLSNLLAITNYIISSLSPFHGYFAIFLTALLYFAVSKKPFRLKEKVALLVTLLLIAEMFTGTFIFAAGKEWWDKIPGSFQRTFIIYVPLLSLSVAYFSENFKKKPVQKSNKKKVIVIQGTQAPYRFPVFNELTKTKKLDLQVWFMSKGGIKNRTWGTKPLKKCHFKYKFLYGWVWNFGLKDNFPFWVNPFIYIPLLKEDPDMVIMLGWDSFTSFIVHLFCKIFGVKFVLWSGSTANEKSWRRDVTKPLVSLHAKCADAHIAYGTRAKKYLESLGVDKKKIFISFNSTNTKLYTKLFEKYKKQEIKTKDKLKIPQKSKVVIHYGQLIRRKGTDLLLKAFSKNYKNSKDATLLIAGTGPFVSDLKKIADELKIENVRYIPNPGDEKIWEYYAIADLYVLPSREEVWGLSVNEAMVAELPIIVSSVAGCSDDVVIKGKNGYVFKSKNITDLAAKLKKVLDDNKKRKSMGKKSKIMSKDFSPEITVKGFHKMFDHLNLWE
jgi:glycosyltransferase involved in cell wall biosynthesis